jgi:hypothetical protein
VVTAGRSERSLSYPGLGGLYVYVSGPLQAYSAPAVTPSGAFFDLPPRLATIEAADLPVPVRELLNPPSRTRLRAPDHRSETDER